MPEKGEELYKILKADPNYEGVGSDYNKFKAFFSDEKNYTNLYNTLKADPNYEGIGKDVNAFSEYFGFKKKDQQVLYGNQAFGGKKEEPLLPLTSSTVSPSASKPPTSTTPSVSTGKLPKLDFQVEKPVSTATASGKDLAVSLESRGQRKDYLTQASAGILETIQKSPDLFISQKDMPTMYGEKIIPAGTPNVKNIAKAVDLYAEKIQRETGKELSSFDKQYIVQNTLSSLKVKNQAQNAAMLTNLQFQEQKKIPLTAVTGIKNAKGEVVKEGMFQENIKNTIAQEQQRLEQIAKTPNKEINAEFKTEVEGLNLQVKSNADALNQEMKQSFTAQFTQQQNEIYSQYTELVQSGQMPADVANAEMKQKLEAIGKQLEKDTNDAYAPKFAQLKQDTDVKVKEIQTRYNRRVQAQFDIEKDKANKRIQEEISKYSTSLPKGYLEEYQAAFQKNFDSQMKIEGLRKTVAFSNLGNVDKMQTAIMAGWGDVAGTVGGALSYVGVNTGELQNWVAQSGLYNELPVISGESVWDDITNTDWWIANGVRSIPFTVATMPVGVLGGGGVGMLARALGATRRAEIISSVIGGGLIGWDAEKLLEQGSIFNDSINEGKSVEEASEIAAAVGKYNFATIPLNIAQMLPVFGSSFKFLTSSLVEAGSGYLEETAQGWAQAKARAESEGKDVSYLEYMTSPQAIEEGIIGAGMSQGFTLFSLNNTPDIDKKINALMTSLGTGGENQAAMMLEVMKNNDAIDSKQYEEAKALLNYTLNAINQTQNINVDDNIKASLVNKFVAIEKAKELLTEDENDLASQAAKELIAEKENEIKGILKGSEPVYLIKIQGNEVPVVSTKEQIDALLSNPASLPLFEIEVYNDIKTQASVEEAYSKQEKDKSSEDTQTGIKEGEEVENIPEGLQAEETDIQLSGLRDGTRYATKNAFDITSDQAVMENINNGKSFTTTVSRNGKEFVVVGLKIKGISGQTNGRDGYSFATIEKTDKLPANINDILVEKAKENAKNLYLDIPNIEFEGQSTESPANEKEVEFGTAFNIQDATAENTVGKEKDLWGRAQVWRERIENAGDILRELSSRGDKPDSRYLMEKVKKLRDWIAESKKGYTPIDKSIKTIEDFEKTNLKWSDAVDSREYLEKFHSDVLDRIRSEYEAIPTYTKEQRLALELVIDLINNNIEGLESKLNEIENISSQINANGKLPIIEDIKLGKKVEQTKKQQDAVQEQTAGQVPVQPKTEVSEEVEGGKPKAEPKEATEEKREKVAFPDNLLKIAKELDLSPQQIQNTYNKYDGSKKIEDITTEDYKAARAIGDKVKIEATTKAFDALLQVEAAEKSASPSAKKAAQKTLSQADEKALKEAAKVMEHIDEIRAKLQESGVIESTSCKWGK